MAAFRSKIPVPIETVPPSKPARDSKIAAESAKPTKTHNHVEEVTEVDANKGQEQAQLPPPEAETQVEEKVSLDPVLGRL